MRGSDPRPIGRLTKRSDFVAAATGRRFHTERMTVQGRLRDDDSGLRVGLTVTRRVGHATERNRIKRRLRAAVRDAAGPYGWLSVDVVLIGRRDILTASYPVLIDDLERALRVVTKPKSARPAGALSHTDRERAGTSDA